jgi:cell division protein FtsW
MVFFPIFGRHFLGASRWLTIKGVSFQPSEFLKFTSIIYLASLISKHFSETYKTSKKKKNKSISLFFAFIIVLGIISIILICQPDISTLIIIGSALIFVYFSAKTPLYQTLILLLLSILGTVLLLTSAPYRFKRLLVFLNPEIDPLGLSYQLRQSLIAIGSGGVFGEGIGMSRQKFGFLPQPISDSIFSVFAEETGFIGCLFLIALYLFFFYRGVKISRNASSTFLELSGIGISFLIIIQAFLHIAGLSGILPLTGSVLPFISYGGSHLIMELMSVGFLLNISKHQRI